MVLFAPHTHTIDTCSRRQYIKGPEKHEKDTVKSLSFASPKHDCLFFLTHRKLLSESERPGNILTVYQLISHLLLRKPFLHPATSCQSNKSSWKNQYLFWGSSALPFLWLHKPGYGLLADGALFHSINKHDNPCCGPSLSLGCTEISCRSD